MSEKNDLAGLMNNHHDEVNHKQPSPLAQSSAVSGENKYLANPELGLQLCASLIADQNNKGEASEILETLWQTIRYRFLPQSKKAGNSASATVYDQLLNLYNQLREVANFPELEQSYTVAVGGSFSSGKSRFLNSVMGCPSLLPTDTTPTTSIPTYLFKGNTNRIDALNTYMKKTPIDEDALKAICHAFNQRFQVTFSHLLQLIAVQRNRFSHPNLIFLDTPGYSKSDNIDNANSNTDENIAREHLRSADYLIWLVDQQNGTVPRPDIEFIQSLNIDQPILIVISKADKRPEQQIQEIIANTKNDLDKTEIDYVDVIAYSSRLNKEFSDSSQVLQHFLEEVNQSKEGSALLWQLEQISGRYLNQFDTDRQALKLSQSTVNELIYDESVTEGKKQHLYDLQSKTRQQLDALTLHRNEAEALLGEIKESVESLLLHLGISAAHKPNRVQLKSLRKKQPQQEQALQTVHLNALVSGNIKPLAKCGTLSGLAGHIKKISAVGASIELEAEQNLEIMILQDEIRTKLDKPATTAFKEGLPVTVQIVGCNKCEVIVDFND